MHSFVKLILENSDKELLREILFKIDEDVIKKAIVDTLDTSLPVKTPRDDSEITIKLAPNWWQKSRDDALARCVVEMQKNCSMSITRRLDAMDIVLTIAKMKTQSTGRIVPIKWIRNETDCTLKDAQFIVNMIFEDPIL